MPLHLLTLFQQLFLIDDNQTRREEIMGLTIALQKQQKLITEVYGELISKLKMQPSS